MNELENEIIEKFDQLDPEAKQRVLHKMNHILRTSFDYEAWWSEVEALQEDMRARNGDKPPVISAVDMLREIRDGEDE